MVDHTYLFSPAVRKLKELKLAGVLGKITYYDSLRVNLGLFQSDVNVLWDLAPHDFSIMDYILEEQPVDVEASGYCHVNSHLPDIAYFTSTLSFEYYRPSQFKLDFASQGTAGRARRHRTNGHLG